VPGGTSGNTAAGDGEEAAWRDLIARYDAPAPAGGETPWPDREDLAGPVHVTPAPPVTPPPPPDMPTLPDALPREPPPPPAGPSGLAGPAGLPRVPGMPGAAETPTMPGTPGTAGTSGAGRVPGNAGTPGAGGTTGNAGTFGASGTPGTAGTPGIPGAPWPPAGRGPRDSAAPANPADEHYVPPPPPPLPKLAPMTVGAWVALLGGPLYLLIATATGGGVSGLAAFLSVAAFVGGFAVLILRMDSNGPRDSGPDDGAVV
jgi:hypothetical protein